MVHFNIGVAMARSGESDRAILAFETALRFHPNMVNAHRYLATLHRDNGGDGEKAAAFHQQEGAKIIRSRPRARTAKTDGTDKLFDLPEIPERERAAEDSLARTTRSQAGGEEIRKDFRPRFWVSTLRNLPDDGKNGGSHRCFAVSQKSGVLSERHRLGQSRDEV